MPRSRSCVLESPARAAVQFPTLTCVRVADPPALYLWHRHGPVQQDQHSVPAVDPRGYPRGQAHQPWTRPHLEQHPREYTHLSSVSNPHK